MTLTDVFRDNLINLLSPEEMAEALQKDLDTLSMEATEAVERLVIGKQPPRDRTYFGNLGQARAKIGSAIAATEKKHSQNAKAHADVLQKTVEKRLQRIEAYALRRRTATPTKKGAWIIVGRVTDSTSGRGLANVTVNAYDMDRKTDDYLGTTRTDALGYYRVEYTESAFKDLGDRQPESYIVVLDDEGTPLYTSPKSFVEKSAAAAQIDAVIDGSKVPEKMAISNNVSGYVAGTLSRLANRRELLTGRRKIAANEPSTGKSA